MWIMEFYCAKDIPLLYTVSHRCLINSKAAHSHIPAHTHWTTIHLDLCTRGPGSDWFHWAQDDWDSIETWTCFSKPKLYIWKFSVQVLLKPSLKDFDLNLASMCNEHSCTVVNILWHFPSLRLKWKVTFSSPVATEFSKFTDILSATL